MYYVVMRSNRVVLSRWPKDGGSGVKYLNLVPSLLPKQTGEEEEDEGGPKRARKARREQDFGALYHEYDWTCHQFIAHLRRVHPGNPSVMMNVAGKQGQVLVKAADPLAEKGMPLYYFHSKTKLYNDIFFHFWDCVMAPAFAIVCPWFTVDSQESLDTLFALEFEK